MPNIEADECIFGYDGIGGGSCISHSCIISNSLDSVKIVFDTDVDEEYDAEGREAPSFNTADIFFCVFKEATL